VTDYYFVLSSSEEGGRVWRASVFTDAPETVPDAVYILGPIETGALEDLLAAGIYLPEYWDHFGDAIAACGADERLAEQVKLQDEERRDG
jgi:hypothetical protein